LEAAKSRRARSGSARASKHPPRNADPQRSDPGPASLEPILRKVPLPGKKDIRVGALPRTYRTTDEDEVAEREKCLSHRQILQQGLGTQVDQHEQRRRQADSESKRYAKHVEEDRALWSEAKELERGILSARAHCESRSLDLQVAEKRRLRAAQTARGAVEERQAPPVLLCGEADPDPQLKKTRREQLAEVRKADLHSYRQKKAAENEFEARESAQTTKAWSEKLKEQASKSFKHRELTLEGQVDFSSIGERTGLPAPRWSPEVEDAKIAAELQEKRKQDTGRERETTRLKQKARDAIARENSSQLQAHSDARQAQGVERAKELSWVIAEKEADSARRRDEFERIQAKTDWYVNTLDAQVAQRARLRAAGGGVLYPPKPLTERSAAVA